MGGIGHTDDQAGVLLGEQPFGDDDVKPDGGHQGQTRHPEGQRLVAQDPLQAAIVGLQQSLEHAVGEEIEAAVFRFVLRLQEARAHHRRERQRHDRRNRHRRAERDGKLAEEPADDAGHENQRDEHRDQRDAQRDDGKANLFGPFEGGLHGRFARFDEADDIFDHHDGIVHHKPGRDRQGHQREVVEAEPGQLHQAEGAHHGQRQRHARDGGGPEFAQEHKDHHHHQHDRQHQRELDIGHRGADGLGAVGQDGDGHRRRDHGAQLGEQRFDAVGGLDDVGAGLALNVQDDGRLLIHPAGHPHILHVVNHLADVANPHGRPVLVGEDDLPKLGGGEDLVVGVDGVGLPFAVEAAFGRVDVVLHQGRAHVLEAQAPGRHGPWVDADAHRGLLVAFDGHQAHPGHFAQFLRQHRIGQIVDLLQGQGVRGDLQRENRRIGRVDFAIDRRVGHLG